MLVRIVRHYVPFSVVVLGAVEILILLGTMYLGVALRFPGGIDPNSELGAQILPILPKALVFAVVMFASIMAFGLYQREQQQSSAGYFGRCVASFLTGLLVMVLIFYAVPELYLGRGAFAFTFLLAFVGHLVARVVFLRLVDHKALRRRILVLGTGSRAAKISQLEKYNGSSERFHVVGYVPLNDSHRAVDPSMIIEQSDSLDAITRKYKIDEIVVGVRDRRHGDMPMDELLERKMSGTGVIDLLTFFERETGKVELESLNPSWLIFSDGFRLGTLKRIAKRIFDIIASSILLFMTLPVMLLTATLIRLEGPGPILYRQERVGEAGRTFLLLKFRSMREDAEADGTPQWASHDDARCTRVGRIIRALRIDELPQLLNVLRGQMSFVGPRPERSKFVKDLTKQINYYGYRHTVKPGITGWAQVSYPYGASVKDAQEKLQYDLYYVKNQSLFLDLVILAQTAHIVLFGKGAR
jgi:sugar transferase (PEP-CTERM system associated)